MSGQEPEPIDLCIALLGNRAGGMLQTYLQTLYECCDMQNVMLHLVDRDGREATTDQMQQAKQHHGARLYRLQERFGELHGTKRQTVTNWVSDTAGVCQWMLDNCGEARWCILSHFDLTFYSDIITAFRARMDSETGQVGHHSKGFVAYRRDAVKQCSCGFSSMAGFYLVRNEFGDYKVRHGGDPRCTDKSLPILGFDVCELLELNICAKGWSLGVLTEEEWRSFLFHKSGGSDYHQTVTTFDDPA